MNIYLNLVILGVIGFALLAFSSFQVVDPLQSFMLSVFSYGVFLIIAFINTRAWLEKEHSRKIIRLTERYERKIRRMKYEHDTATLEKTIRDGTKTLIKNAVDYFKIENIKNEMPSSAAIQNLQLDKYGQIIELLADFSLILPDFEENKEIVLQEINHQIGIYQTDEKPFAEFLRSIMGKYILAVNKKIREKIRAKQEPAKIVRSCPNCSERIQSNARICKRCGQAVELSADPPPVSEETAYVERIRQGAALFREGNYPEAIHMFSQAIRLNPNADQAYYSRGVAYRRIDKTREAIADLRAAAKLGHEKAKEVINMIEFYNENEWLGSPSSPPKST